MSIQTQNIATDADAYHAIVAGENAIISTPSDSLQEIAGFIQATEVRDRFSCSNLGALYVTIKMQGFL